MKLSQFRTIALLLIMASSINLSCKKDKYDADVNCNDVVMRLKRAEDPSDDRIHISAEWNTDGTMRRLEYNTMFSNGMAAVYEYVNGKIKTASYSHIGSTLVEDKVFYSYSADGKLDSMYAKGNTAESYKLKYQNGKLSRLIEYRNGQLQYYWDITIDDNDNIIKAEEWWLENGKMQKESVYTFGRDSKKNPLKGMGPYMLYFASNYEIFRSWGSNNNTSQQYQEFEYGLNVTTGDDYKYNENCYPSSSKMTIGGGSFSDDDDMVYTYY